MDKDKPFNDGQWTEGRMNTFITGIIRAGLNRWGPKHQCIKDARVRRGWYLCAGCKQEVPASIKRELKTKPGVVKKTKNIWADHIDPVIDPAVGRRSWDEYIERMYVDLKHWQALCYDCHAEKTAEERAIRTERERRERNVR